MRVLFLMTYKQYLNKEKGYKRVGQASYYYYCENMCDTSNILRNKDLLTNSFIDDYNTCYKYYNKKVTPNALF